MCARTCRLSLAQILLAATFIVFKPYPTGTMYRCCLPTSWTSVLLLQNETAIDLKKWILQLQLWPPQPRSRRYQLLPRQQVPRSRIAVLIKRRPRAWIFYPSVVPWKALLKLSVIQTSRSVLSTQRGGKPVIYLPWFKRRRTSAMSRFKSSYNSPLKISYEKRSKWRNPKTSRWLILCIVANGESRLIPQTSTRPRRLQKTVSLTLFGTITPLSCKFLSFLLLDAETMIFWVVSLLIGNEFIPTSVLLLNVQRPYKRTTKWA